LGDWTLRESAWGDGRFGDMVRHVKNLGMQFGLWFEPEMINEDSDLARAHPEWIMQVPGRLPVEARHQQVLDLTHPGAFDYIRSNIVSLVHEYDIDFIKWDHNRDLIDAGSTRTGRAGAHEQTLRVYDLIDAIRLACPNLEIESCSSGGARVDLGILERTDRVWASDCIDAHERQQIQRWTAQLIPPELVGSHVGSERAHTTGRKLDLSFRAATALFGHFGIEWDLSSASRNEIAELSRWVELYKRHRTLIHTGRVVRREQEAGSVVLLGAVSPDQTEALYAISVLDRPVTWPAGRTQLPGLDPAGLYYVRSANPGFDASETDRRVYPAWWRDGLTARGDVLLSLGVQVPALNPDHTALLHVTSAS
jgi:alpha-galactosidase